MTRATKPQGTNNTKPETLHRDDSLTCYEKPAMKKEDLQKLQGVVTELLPNATFRVRLVNDREVLAHTAGKMRKHRIRVLVGDRVDVEISPYDLTKGRVVFRHK